MSKTPKSKKTLTESKAPPEAPKAAPKQVAHTRVVKKNARREADKHETTLQATEPQTPQKDTEMEVHHHPQLDHRHKPWKEYLLEGFMIFIAVMMGFIAENVRENITNSEHAEQLTSQLAQDLRADIKNWTRYTTAK